MVRKAPMVIEGSGRAASREGDLVFVADAHLRPGRAEVGRFVTFLTDIRASASVLFILGDLFDTWFGMPDLQGSHNREVVEALRHLADSGVRIRFVEGNRDFRIGPTFLRDPFERIGTRQLTETYGGRRFWAEHGDRVNRSDRGYLIWRSFAKSRLTQTVFGWLPASTRLRIVGSLENSLKKTNARHRILFPFQECERFAERVFNGGADVIVLGHFHQERILRYRYPDGDKILYVLPAWYEAGGYLRFRGRGEGEFIDGNGAKFEPSRETAPGVSQIAGLDAPTPLDARCSERSA
ncbi:MAG: metallophosphoesterase [Acidobacteriota bacterium]